MFDWLRELTKSAEIRQQERITAYVDNQLSQAERQQFEAEMRDDAALQAEVDALQRLKTGLRAMPRAAAPRNFLLDPAEFTKPAPAYEARAYPVLRGATVMAGLMFMLLLIFGTLTNGGNLTSAPVAMESIAVEDGAMMEEAAEIVAEPLLQPMDEAMAEAEPMPEPVAEEAEEVIVVATQLIEVVVEQELEAEAMADEVMADAEPALEEAAPAMDESGAATANFSEAPTVAADARSAESLIIVPPTETPELAKSAEIVPSPTPAPSPTLSPPTLSAEIQATDEIAEHDVISTEISEPPAEGVQGLSDVPNVRTRLMIGVGVLFVLLLVATIVIRQRLNDL